MTVLIGAASLAALLAITACKQFLADMDEELGYWASEPVITGFRAASPAQTNPAGVQCVPSATDAVITLTVRNPKNFLFVMPGDAGAPPDIVSFGSNIHDSSGTNPPAANADYTLSQSAHDTLTLTYKPAFLKRYEHSRANIGTSITLYSTDGRKFNQTYSFDLEANTPPPNPAPVEAAAGKIALFKTYTADSQGKHYYVLCFKADGLPGENVLSGVPLHSDLMHVYVSKNGGTETLCPVTLKSDHSDFDIAHSGGTFIAKTAVAQLSTTEAAVLSGSPQPGIVPSGPWVLYLKTDVPVGAAAAKYGIRLFDRKLYSVRAEQTIGKSTLPAPKVFAHADIDNVAAFGVYTEATKIVTPGSIATIDSNDLNGGGAPIGGVSPDGSDETHAIPVYSAYGNAVKLTIKKPDGTDYPAGVTVTGSAEKDSGDSVSGSASFTGGQSASVTLPSPINGGGEAVYKVVFKATGEGFDDSTTRTLYYKVRREVKAVNSTLPMWYMLGAAIEKIPLGGAGTVKISGTVKAENIGYPPLPDGSPVVNNSAIDVSGKRESGDYPGRTVTVIGDSKTSSILDASNLCSVFNVEFNGKLILKNVTLQNGKDSSGGYGGGIYIGDNDSSCEMTDTDIKNCTVSGGQGGAVYVKIDGSLTVGSGCVISDNTAPGGKGEAVYLASGGTFNIAGDAKIDEANDVYLAKHESDSSKNAKITVTASLTDSHTVAKITPEDYTAGVTAVNAASGVDISAYANRFKITDEPNSSPPPLTVPWKLIYNGSTLVLKQVTTVIPSGSDAWKTLKEAIEASSVEDGDEFLVQGAITATSATDNYGAISVTKKITVKGTGSTPVLNANSSGTNRPPTPHRIFTVEDGGELTLENLTLKNGMAAGTTDDEKCGGGILVKAGCKAKLTNCTVKACEAAEFGGGICSEGELTLDGGTIGGASTSDGNKATNQGGGICIQKNGRFTLKTATISENKATYGGAVCVRGSGSVSMESGFLTTNTVGSLGGGVHVDGSSASFTMTGGKIKTNNANGGGGGVYVHSGTFTLSGSASIESNIAEGQNGGGIYVDSTGKLEMKGGSIKSNKATKTSGGTGMGGGVYVYGNGPLKGMLDMSGGSIEGNGAGENSGSYEGSGGGVYIDGGTFTATGGEIKTNNAKNGGGVYAEGGAEITLKNTQINSCVAEENGGGLYIKESTLTLNNATIGGDQLYSGTQAGVTKGNKAKNGGGIFLTGSGTDGSTMTGGKVSFNLATDTSAAKGGGIYIEKSASFTMESGNINDNKIDTGSVEDGGGVYVRGQGVGSGTHASFTLNGGTIGDNAAGFGGGVMVTAGGSCIMTNGTISGNRANYGGGVCTKKADSTDGVFTMQNGTITGNRGVYNGGAAEVHGIFNWNGGSITGNVSNYGEIIHQDGGNFNNNCHGTAS